MTTLTPKQVLKKFNSKSSLIEIADRKGLTLTKNQEKRVADILAEETIKTGIKKVLTVLTKKILKKLAAHDAVDLEEERREKKAHDKNISSSDLKEWFPVKSILVTKLSTVISEYGVTQFFEDQDDDLLLDCCKAIDDLSDYSEDELAEFSKDDLVNGILNNIYTFGLQNLFGSFTISELAGFCEDCDLKVKSSAKEVLLDCLVEQVDYRKKAGRRAPREVMSKKKPKIRDGITKIDMEQWFLRSELEDFCKDEGMKRGGTKRELIKRILLYFEGERGSAVMPGKRGRQKKKSKSKSKKSADSADE